MRDWVIVFDLENFFIDSAIILFVFFSTPVGHKVQSCFGLYWCIPSRVTTPLLVFILRRKLSNSLCHFFAFSSQKVILEKRFSLCLNMNMKCIINEKLGFRSKLKVHAVFMIDCCHFKKVFSKRTKHEKDWGAIQISLYFLSSVFNKMTIFNFFFCFLFFFLSWV